jgi:hypothetical protein
MPLPSSKKRKKLKRTSNELFSKKRQYYSHEIKHRIFSFLVLEMVPRALYMLGKYSTTKLQPQHKNRI